MMEAPKTLALSHCFPPMALPRSIQVSRLLGTVAAGTVVVCGEDPQVRQDRTIAPAAEGAFLQVIRLPVAPQLVISRKLNGLADIFRLSWQQFPDRWRSWNRRTCRDLLAGRIPLPFRPQVLVTFGQPMSDHLSGLTYHRATGMPWIAHFSDPWADNPYRRDNPLGARFNRTMERQVAEEAGALLFPSQELLEAVMGKYPDRWRARAHVLPHCFDPAVYPRDVRPPQEGYVIRWIGNFYPPRTAEPLYRAVEAVARRSPGLLDGAVLELAGFAEPPDRGNYPAAARIVRLLGAVSYGRSLELMRSAHCLLVIDAPADFSVFFPSKLADYLGSGRFVAAFSPPGVSARIVGEAGGPVADPADGEGAAGLLADLLRRRPRRLPDPPKDLGLDVVGKRFGDILGETLQSCRRGNSKRGEG